MLTQIPFLEFYYSKNVPATTNGSFKWYQHSKIPVEKIHFDFLFCSNDLRSMTLTFSAKSDRELFFQDSKIMGFKCVCFTQH